MFSCVVVVVANDNAMITPIFRRTALLLHRFSHVYEKLGCVRSYHATYWLCMVALVISEFEFNVKYYLRDRAAVHDTLFEMTLWRACVPREEMMTPKGV